MIFTYTGQFDLSLDPSDHLTIPPGFTWPAPLKKLVEQLDGAYEVWTQAEVRQLEAHADYAASQEADKTLLIAAIANGDPDPGTPNEPAAAAAARYADESTRHAATALNAAILAIRVEIPKHREALKPQAAKLEREAIEKYATVMGQAMELVNEATPIGRSIGTRVNWLTEQLGEQTTTPRIEVTQEEVSWPETRHLTNPEALAKLDRYESESTEFATPRKDA